MKCDCFLFLCFMFKNEIFSFFIFKNGDGERGEKLQLYKVTRN